MLVFQREIKTEVKEKHNQWVINTHLADTTHEMRVLLTVASNSLQIVAVTAEMIRIPYEVCPEALDNLKQLVGLKVEAGIGKRLGNIMGGSKGCIHLVDLLKEGFKGVVQANIRQHVNGLEGQGRINRLEELLKDSCLRYTRKVTVEANNR